jgi:hypothetical protein
VAISGGDSPIHTCVLPWTLAIWANSWLAVFASLLILTSLPSLSRSNSRILLILNAYADRFGLAQLIRSMWTVRLSTETLLCPEQGELYSFLYRNDFRFSCIPTLVHLRIGRNEYLSQMIPNDHAEVDSVECYFHPCREPWSRARMGFS